LNNARIGKRIVAGIIDFAIFAVIAFIMSFLLVSTVFQHQLNMQLASFVFIEYIVVPFIVIIEILTHPDAYGVLMPYVAIFALLFFTEITFYTLSDLLFSATIGHKSLNLKLCEVNGKKSKFIHILLRNVLKVSSRYLFALPLFTMLLAKDKRSIYDKITKLIVVEIGGNNE
jgi:uncharacterized RDD family membrane protein YckC